MKILSFYFVVLLPFIAGLFSHWVLQFVAEFETLKAVDVTFNTN